MFKAFDTRLTRWITGSESNAAGRLGLYRILYAVFYLWLISGKHFSQMVHIPAGEWRPVPILAGLPGPPSAATLQIAELLLVIGLISLVIGWRVRPATLLVICAGTFLSGVGYSFGKIDHGDTFLVVYIPAIMLFSRWGHTYSLEAWLNQSRGRPVPSVTDGSWPYAWPLRMLLLLLSVMYLSAGYAKMVTGTWLWDFELMSKLLVNYNIGPDSSLLAPIIAGLPVLYLLLHFGTLILETFFPLALLGRAWRTAFLVGGVALHTGILFLMNISFTPLIILYALFVDWQSLYDRLPRPALNRPAELLQHPPPHLIEATAAAVVLALALSWPETRQLLRLFPRDAGLLLVMLFAAAGLWQVASALRGWLLQRWALPAARPT